MTHLSRRLRSWSPPEEWTRVLAVDAHTEGEPLRVFVSGFPSVEGATVLERRREASRHHDGLRRALMWEPRGHADMYGCLVGSPVTPRADFSVLFTHNEGFSTMCGHGIIGVVTVLLETGLVRPDETVAHGARSSSHGAGPSAAGSVVVGIDTPAGFVEATALLDGDRVAEVSFLNVPSFVARTGAVVHVSGLGAVTYDLAYGGAFYAYVEAGAHGLGLTPDEAPRLAAVGRAIKDAVQRSDPPVHPEARSGPPVHSGAGSEVDSAGGALEAAPAADSDAEDLGFVYGTIFIGPAHDGGRHSRNVCVFADGEVDRSPTGTGVSGRLALHHARGDIEVGEKIVIESILGTCFTGSVVETCVLGGIPAVVPRVAGRAWITGVNELLLDPTDPLAGGFLLR